jgi:hypothetical protein
MARQRQINTLRSVLREFYPAALAAFGSDLGSPDALALLGHAPTPAQGQALTLKAVTAVLRRRGRRRNLDQRARQIHEALQSEQLQPGDTLARAFGATVTASVGVIAAMNRQLTDLEAELEQAFDAHPDAEIIRSQPGLGVVLGARVLGEFGDDPTRYHNARSRRCYAGTAPITKESGTKKLVLARFVRNQRLGDACHWWAFCALSASPGARAFYDAHRARGDGHDQALRALANRLVGILDGCLRHRTPYDENLAWGHRHDTDKAAA